jgi:hypothetical protein
MKTFTISLTENQAAELLAHCAAQPGVSPEALIAAWVADKLDRIRLRKNG